jgi:hypothetical protein
MSRHFNVDLATPREHGIERNFGAIVADNHARLTPLSDQIGQFSPACDARSRCPASPADIPEPNH